MSTFISKVHNELGGDTLTIDPGGTVNFSGITFAVNANGKLVIAGLPTVDPHVAGAIWNNADVLTISAG